MMEKKLPHQKIKLIKKLPQQHHQIVTENFDPSSIIVRIYIYII